MWQTDDLFSLTGKPRAIATLRQV